MKFMVKMQCHVKLSRSGATCLRTDVQTLTKLRERASTATNSKIVSRMNDYILANRHIIDEISLELDISHGSVHDIIANQF